ncbi:MAG TPA: hypothetical protein PKZ76_06925 [Xanthomonadaceae bacterium]|nr:hypothetical protein [Xanthomonadaceae bacterium]
MDARRLFGQALVWAALIVPVGLLAQWPSYAPVPHGHGELKLSMAHLTQRMAPCRVLSEEERMALPPNMRVREVCERARAPAVLEIVLDGAVLVTETVRPAGLHRDGRAYLHRVVTLPAGRHALELRLRDSPREDGWDREQTFALDLKPGMSALLRIGDGEATLRAGR